MGKMGKTVMGKTVDPDEQGKLEQAIAERKPTPDSDGQGDLELVIEQHKLLDKLKLRSFTSTPGTIHPFETATLRWEVDVPESVSSEIDVTFTLGSANVPAAGSRAVSPLLTAAFVLEAHSSLTKRQMGTQIVRVDAGDCREASLPRASLEFNAQALKNLFRAGRLQPRGDISLSMRPPDALLVKVPLDAEIENYFDADIDVDLTIGITITTLPGGRRVAAATLRSVSVDVVFTLFEHIFSAGTATAAQAIVEPFAEDLIKAFLRPQLENILRAGLQPVIDTFLNGFRANDPAKREFRLLSLTCEPEGLIIVCCPLPPPSPAVVGT